MRTLKLCGAPSNRPTTLLGAIARSVAELERSGQSPRPIRIARVRGPFA